MKAKQFNKKLFLNKKTVADLNPEKMDKIQAKAGLNTATRPTCAVCNPTCTCQCTMYCSEYLTACDSNPCC